jgi:hypothetical protein
MKKKFPIKKMKVIMREINSLAPRKTAIASFSAKDHLLSTKTAITVTIRSFGAANAIKIILQKAKCSIASVGILSMKKDSIAPNVPVIFQLKLKCFATDRKSMEAFSTVNHAK